MATIFQSSQRSPAASSEEYVPAARAHSVLELIGNTPLLEITRVTEGLLRPGVRIFAKLEGFNPGGSVKDRAARHMIEFGLQARRTASGQGHHRFDLGQHRDRAGDGRCGARLSGRDRDGLQRQPRAQEDNRGLRRQADLLRSAGGLRRRYHALRARSSPPTPIATSNPTNTITRPIRSPISTPPGPKSGIRRAAASPTSWPESAPAAP